MLLGTLLTIGSKSLPDGLTLRGVINGDERDASGKARGLEESLKTRDGSTSERQRGCLDPARSSSARLRDGWANLCNAPTGTVFFAELGAQLTWWNPEATPSTLGEGC